MKRNEILECIKTLAHSQGSYDRLLNYIYKLDSTDYENFMTELERQNFKDTLDLVFYFEC